ncbi:MAG TPA: aminotransferase class I/II-fold pyridoxal phosphate-dependent enzyme, partial [Burkholderiaceae bacterium]
MNPQLARLHPYPFERWRQLTVGVQHRGDLSPIGLGIGEPRHATPALIEQAITGSLQGLSVYPPTIGEPRLREACAAWLMRRYAVRVDPATQLLPVNGSREALFALAQVVLDASRDG